jgi:hypothetical protein
MTNEERKIQINTGEHTQAGNTDEQALHAPPVLVPPLVRTAKDVAQMRKEFERDLQRIERELHQPAIHLAAAHRDQRLQLLFMRTTQLELLNWMVAHPAQLT